MILTSSTSARESHIALDTCRTFATEANLRKAIAKLDPKPSRADGSLTYTVIRTPSGRWTALFIGDCQDALFSGYPCFLF